MSSLSEVVLAGAIGLGMYELYHHHHYGNFGFGNPNHHFFGGQGYTNPYGYDNMGFNQPTGYHHHHRHHLY